MSWVLKDFKIVDFVYYSERVNLKYLQQHKKIRHSDLLLA